MNNDLYIPDSLFPTDNDFEVPSLRLDMQATTCQIPFVCFGREKKTAERYSKGAVLTALVKKSDIMPRDGLSTERITNSERYIPKGSKFKNGSAVTDSDRKDLFNTSTLAAHKRYKSAEASYSAVVVVDRSAI